MIQTNSNINIDEAREPLLTWEPKKKATHLMDYFVPNFGMDTDIEGTFRSIKKAEKITGNKWNPVFKKDVKTHPMDYFVPNFGPDEDVKNIADEIKNAENELGTQWTYTPKEQRPAPHPVDYFVPSFGPDPDIVATQENERKAKIDIMAKRWTNLYDADTAKKMAQDKIDEAKKAELEAAAAAAKAEAARIDAEIALKKQVTEEAKQLIREKAAKKKAADLLRKQKYDQDTAVVRESIQASETQRKKDEVEVP